MKVKVLKETLDDKDGDKQIMKCQMAYMYNYKKILNYGSQTYIYCSVFSIKILKIATKLMELLLIRNISFVKTKKSPFKVSVK